MNENLEGKVFIISSEQSSRYDDTLKVLLGYISEKYDHHVASYIQYKDKEAVVKLLVRIAILTKPSPSSTNLTVLDKDGEE